MQINRVSQSYRDRRGIKGVDVRLQYTTTCHLPQAVSRYACRYVVSIKQQTAAGATDVVDLRLSCDVAWCLHTTLCLHYGVNELGIIGLIARWHSHGPTNCYNIGAGHIHIKRIQRQITRLIVSRVWSIQWFRFQWPWPRRLIVCAADARSVCDS